MLKKRLAGRISCGLVSLALALGALGAVAQGASRPDAVAASGAWVYFGTYTHATSRGIYRARWDARTGKVGPVTLAVATDNPSYFVIARSGRFLYAVNEMVAGQADGAVSAFALDPSTGALKLLNQVPSGGTAPCYISIDKTGQFLFVANYGSGSVAIFRRNPDGSVGERTAFWQHAGHSVNPARQAGPHAHFALVSPDNHYLLSADLGMDRILVDHFNAADGTISPATPPGVSLQPGTGPRHFLFADQGRRVYAVSEMGSMLFAFNYHDGRLTEFQSLSTKPADFSGENSGAEIALAPDGRFVYVSNRGANTIAQFAVDRATGRVSLVEDVSTQGSGPRMFQLSPDGRYLWAANQNSANVVEFRRDETTGRLTPTGVTVKLSMPVCIQFYPAQ